MARPPMRIEGIAADAADGDVTASRRRSSSVPVAGREAGSLARHCMISAASAGGQSGRSSATGVGVSLMCATRSLCGGRPENGGCCAISSYAMQPHA